MVLRVSADVEASIRDMIERGQFSDEDEAVRAGIELLERQEKVRRLRAALAEGEKGPFRELTDEVWDEINRRADEMIANGEPISDAVTP